ncbi:O-antigen ligase family protein [Salinibacter ruber]|uniref:O-antigen ligase family protein n=1 Tax=Salinibacter ruber TaxID=146919 RepID=UPI002169C84E|nr:O-antigen ligase family protein [Salinibacter ruber]MCS4054474.1 O-antigen ligase [Salinibacter ruber]
MIRFILPLCAIASIGPLTGFIPREAAYILSLSVLVAASVTIVMKDKYRKKVIYRFTHYYPYWVFAIILITSQVIVSATRVYTVYGMLKSVAYVIVLGTTLIVISCGVYYERKSFWSSVATFISFVSVVGMIGTYTSMFSKGLFVSTIYDIPVIGIKPLSSIISDENYYSFVAGVGIFSGIYSSRCSKSIKKRAFLKSTVAVNVAGIILAGSRTGYAAIIVSWILYLNTGRKYDLLKALSGALAAGMLIIGLTYVIATDKLFAIFEVTRGLTGREELWSVGLESIKQNPLFGSGIGNLEDVLYQGGIVKASTHNTYIDLAVQAGVLSALSLTAIILSSLMNLIDGGKKPYKKFLISILVFCIIFSNSLTFTPGGLSFGGLLFAIILGQPIVEMYNEKN